MTLEYDIVLARAGYNEKLKREVTWEELRRTFLLYKRIPMIVAGGSHFGPIDPNEAIGFVDAKMDDPTVRGRAIFYKERFKDVPTEIQQKLALDEHVHASLGYEPFNNIRKIDHLLIGAKSPVFEDIGFNAESNFQYEDTEGINKAEEAEEVPTKEEPKPEQDKGFNETQLSQIRDIITSLLPAPQEAPVEEVKEEEPKIEEPPEEVQPDPQPKPKVEPERTIPKEVPKTSSDGLLSGGGTRVISTPLAGSKTTEEERK